MTQKSAILLVILICSIFTINACEKVTEAPKPEPGAQDTTRSVTASAPVKPTPTAPTTDTSNGPPIGTIAVEGARVTLHRIKETNALAPGDIFKIPAGMKAVFLDISIENTSSAALPFAAVPTVSFKTRLYDTQGKEYLLKIFLMASAFITNDPGFNSKEADMLCNPEKALQPGEKHRSWVAAYELPQTAVLDKLLYTTIFKSGGQTEHVIPIKK